MDSSIFTKAWVDTGGSGGIKDYHAIKRWQSQAAAADPDFFHPTVHVKDEEESNTSSRQPTWKHDERANKSSISQVAVSKERFKNDPREADHIKHAVVVYVGSLLMPLYKARKIDKDGNKSIMKKTATKVMEMTSRSFINWSKGQTSKGGNQDTKFTLGFPQMRQLTILLALTKHTVIFYMEIPHITLLLISLSGIPGWKNTVVLDSGQKEITDRMFQRYGSRLGATGWCSVEGGNEAGAGDEVDSRPWLWLVC
ncbi:hypothetical protein PVK06_015462 [Gossypium arboreum]|uniref:Uncharacterized protein n=1 Tax=Gossypium arboreum TaxID=29729 RepID=A0ABR0PXX5_GOSAR|nr:hypothetical protein PVK06_015462 [Gossypium arboreum]